MYIADVYWLVLSQLRAGQADEAQKTLQQHYRPDMYVGHHTEYKKAMRVAAGFAPMEDMLAEQAAAGDGGLLVRGAEHCAGGGGPSRHPAHWHPRGGYGKFDGLPACFAVAAVGTVRGLLRGGRTGPADFHPAGVTHQNRRAGAGALRPARPAARGA